MKKVFYIIVIVVLLASMFGIYKLFDVNLKEFDSIFDSFGDQTETPDNPDEPGGTETPGNPDEPGGTETPDNPDEPGGTETPDNPDEPDGTETPDEPEVVPTSANFEFSSVDPLENLSDSFSISVSKELYDAYADTAEMLVYYDDKVESMAYVNELSNQYFYTFSRAYTVDEISQKIAENGSYFTQYNFVFRYSGNEYTIESKCNVRQISDIAKLAVRETGYERVFELNKQNEYVGKGRWRIQANGELLSMFTELGYEVDLGYSVYNRMANNQEIISADILVLWSEEQGYYNDITSKTLIQHAYNTSTGVLESASGAFDSDGNFNFNPVMTISPSDYLERYQLKLEVCAFIALKKNNAVSISVCEGSTRELLDKSVVSEKEILNAVVQLSEIIDNDSDLQLSIPEQLYSKYLYPNGRFDLNFAVGVVALPAVTKDGTEVNSDILPAVKRALYSFELANVQEGSVKVIADVKQGSEEGFYRESDAVTCYCEGSELDGTLNENYSKTKFKVFFAFYNGLYAEIAYSQSTYWITYPS